MRGRLTATAAVVLLALMPAGPASAEEAFQLLDVEKQAAEPLPYYLRHVPEDPEGNLDPARKVAFSSLPEGISAHLVDVGYLGGRCCLVAVRYLSDSRLEHGNTNAVGIMLLCQVQSDPPRFAPVAVDRDFDGGAMADFSISPIRQFGDFSFVWLRREYSGKAHSVERTAIVAGDDFKLRTYEIFDKTNPLEKLEKEGWECWTSGAFFDEERLIQYFHLYRDSSQAGREGENQHRRVAIPYEFRDGKLRPGKVEDIDGSGQPEEDSSK